MKLPLIFLLLFLSLNSHARLLQIIHTNDLHSYFTGYQTGGGGYSRVKTVINKIRLKAEARGIEVLQLDAGDWGEGTSYFHANQGVDSLRALELLGTDVATIGNHDHMQGGYVLGHQIRAAKIDTRFTVGNVGTTPEMELDETVFPFIDLEKSNISIRVIGLTTSEIFFRYSFMPGKIFDPLTTGEQLGRSARKAGRELVIALTHIGFDKDIQLANQSTSIDLIVGGHSHTKQNRVYWTPNKRGRPVPIVQAWAHGLGVGSLLIDVDERGRVKVLEYKLHTVNESISPDLEMEKFVKESVQTRNESFPFAWNEVIGKSSVALTGYRKGDPVYRRSCWGWHLANAARKAAGAQVGIHVASFEGVYKPPGEITEGDIADQFPHFRKYGDQGWEIATIKTSGWILRPLMFILGRLRTGITFSGPGDAKGFPLLQDKTIYTVAFPAEVAYAIQSSMPAYRYLLKDLKFTGKYYWPVMSEYVKENSPIECEDH